MKILEIRLKGDKYVLIDNGRESSVTFSDKFRVMAVNKMKFLVKNAQLPVTLKIDGPDGEEILNEVIDNVSQIDKIK